MISTDTAPQTPTEPVTPVTSDPVPTPPGDSDDAARNKRSPSEEAASRRRELRDEQAARAADAAAAADREAALVSQITGYRRGAIESYLTTSVDLRGDGSNELPLHRPADLWDVLAGTPDQFFDDDGALDTVALADFIGAGTVERAYLRQVPSSPPRSSPLAYSSSMTRDVRSRTGGGSESAWGKALSATD
jgi:hypothetical protein